MADNSGPTQQASFTTVEDALTISCIGYNSASLQVTGTWAGVVSFEATNDGTNWFAVSGTPPTSAAGVSSTTANGQWIFALIYSQFRARYSTDTSGTVVVTLCRSQSTIDPAAASGTSGGVVTLAAGTAIAGKFGIDQTTPGTTNAVAPISGQAGVAGGAGAVSATTQRVVLATDTTVPNVTGSVAHDSVDSGNPVKVGAQARTTNPAAVADADRVNFIADKLGKQITVGAIRELKGVQKTTITTSTSETTIVTAVASTFLDLYGLILANTSATIVTVTIRDTTGGSAIAIIEVPANDTRGFMLPVDSAIPQTTVNTNWTAQGDASITSLEITAYYVKNV